MDIHPGRGVGDLLFGLTESQLFDALGPPDRQYRTDSEVRRLQYYAHRLEFAIEPENGDRFGWVEVWNPSAIFTGRSVIGEQVLEVLPRFTQALAEEPEYGDYASFETYFFRRNWLELHVRFGRIECVNWGVLYDEADEPQWPVR
jgi:hypothetical protein